MVSEVFRVTRDSIRSIRTQYTFSISFYQSLFSLHCFKFKQIHSQQLNNLYVNHWHFWQLWAKTLDSKIGNELFFFFLLLMSMCESTVLKFNYSDPFILTTILIYSWVQFAMSMHTTFTSNSYHLKSVWFLSLRIYIHNFRKILIILLWKWKCYS